MRRPPPFLFLFTLTLALLLFPLTMAQLSTSNFTISDASPMLQWDPPVLSVAQAQTVVWNPFPPPQCMDQYGCHNSSTPGSSVSLTFTGTGVWFRVSGPGQITIQVEAHTRTVTVPGGDSTFGIWDLGYQSHTAKLSVVSGIISVVQAIVETAVGGPGTSSLMSQSKAVNDDGTLNSAFKLTLAPDKAWVPNTPWPCATGTNCTAFCSTAAAGGACTHSGALLTTNVGGATLSFTSPKNTSLISIIGSAGSLIGQFNVQISPPPFFGPNQWDNLNPWSITFGVMVDNVLWFVDVDPTVEYTVDVTFVGGLAGQHWDFWGAQFLLSSGGTGALPTNTIITSSSSSASSSSSRTSGSDTATAGGPGDPNNTATSSSGGKSGNSVPVAAVAGGVAGGVVVIIILVILIWRVRKREKAARTLLAHFTVDNSPPEPSPREDGGRPEPMAQVRRNNSSGIDLLSNHGRNRSSVDTLALSPNLAPLTINASGTDAVITPLVLTGSMRPGGDLPMKRNRSSKADMANLRWSAGTSMTFESEDAGGAGRPPSDRAAPASPRSSVVESTSMPPTASGPRQSVQVVQQDESKQPRHQTARVVDPDEYEQEQDAGPVGGRRAVPPRYDPSWASDLEYGGLAMSPLRTAADPSDGPLRAHNPDESSTGPGSSA